MAKKQYPASQYFLAAGLAAAIGLVYLFAMFNPILGPGMLVLAAVMTMMGLKRRRIERAVPAPSP